MLSLIVLDFAKSCGEQGSAGEGDAAMSMRESLNHAD